MKKILFSMAIVATMASMVSAMSFTITPQFNIGGSAYLVSNPPAGMSGSVGLLIGGGLDLTLGFDSVGISIFGSYDGIPQVVSMTILTTTAVMTMPFQYVTVGGLFDIFPSKETSIGIGGGVRIATARTITGTMTLNGVNAGTMNYTLSSQEVIVPFVTIKGGYTIKLTENIGILLGAAVAYDFLYVPTASTTKWSGLDFNANLGISFKI